MSAAKCAMRDHFDYHRYHYPNLRHEGLSFPFLLYLCCGTPAVCEAVKGIGQKSSFPDSKVNKQTNKQTNILCNCQQLRVAILGFALRAASAYWPLAIKGPLACAKQMPSVADL